MLMSTRELGVAWRSRENVGLRIERTAEDKGKQEMQKKGLAE